jgi:poly(A) polymerase
MIPSVYNILMEAIMFNDKINMIFKAFHVHGHEARLVGGCARDFIMGITPNDWDFATTATPDEIAHVAQKSGWTCIPTGIDHGTMTVVVDSEPFEITTLRVDSNQDGRHAEVEFTTDWEKDVMRRDFTINGIYINSAGEIIDLVGGVEDIKNKKRRFIGNGMERMEEDALRVIRGFRFATRFGMDYPEEFARNFIEDPKYATVKSGIRDLSVERIWSELKKIYSIRDYGKLNFFGDTFVLIDKCGNVRLRIVIGRIFII